MSKQPKTDAARVMRRLSRLSPEAMRAFVADFNGPVGDRAAAIVIEENKGTPVGEWGAAFEAARERPAPTSGTFRVK